MLIFLMEMLTFSSNILTIFIEMLRILKKIISHYGNVMFLMEDLIFLIKMLTFSVKTLKIFTKM